MKVGTDVSVGDVVGWRWWGCWCRCIRDWNKRISADQARATFEHSLRLDQEFGTSFTGLLSSLLSSVIIKIIINDNVYGAVLMTVLTVRVHPFHLMKAAKSALNKPILRIHVPFTDLKPTINKYVRIQHTYTHVIVYVYVCIYVYLYMYMYTYRYIYL